MTSECPKSKGASLVEVLVALLILTLGFVSLQRLQVVAIRDNQFASELTRAVHLASGRMEQLLGAPFPSIASGSTNDGAFALAWTVSDDTPVAGCKTVTVEAKWIQQGATRKVRLTRLVVPP